MKMNGAVMNLERIEYLFLIWLGSSTLLPVTHC